MTDKTSVDECKIDCLALFFTVVPFGSCGRDET
jgi:hypothetical protein